MEILTFFKHNKDLSFLIRRFFNKWYFYYTSIKTYCESIFTVFLFLISFSISAQKSVSQEDKIYFAVDSFVTNPTEENLNELALFSQTIFPKLDLKNKDELLSFVILNCNKGYYENQFGKINKAISSYEKAWRMYQTNNLKNYEIVEFCLKPLGNLYTTIGDYDNAENTIKQYYYIATKSNNEEQQYAAVLNLSNVYQNTGRINEAIDLLEKTIHSQKLSDNQKGNLYNNLGSNYVLQKYIPTSSKSNNNAEKAFLKALSLLEKDKTNNESLVNTYRNLSNLKLQHNDPKTALAYFEKAKNTFEKIRNDNPRKKAQLYYDQANLLFRTGNIKYASALISEIFRNLIPNYSNHVNKLPQQKSLYTETVLLDALDLQAAIYEAENQPEKALQSYKLAFYIEELFQSLLIYENSKIISQIRNRNRTEKCLAIYESLFKKDAKLIHLENAFLLTEDTKSAVLRQSLVTFKNQSAIQKHISEQLQIENNFILKEQQKGNLADITKINEAIKKQNKWMLQLKQTTPEAEKKVNPKLRLTDLYNKLEKDKTILVEYFSGIEKMYSFTIEDKKIHFNSFSNNANTSAKITQFIDFFNEANAIANAPNKYNATGNIAYELLKLPKNSEYKNLLIIPDGLLYFLPFEALITKPSATTNFAKMNYLLLDYNICYQNSAQFYLASSTKKKQESVLGIFPVFDKTSYALTYSKDEMQYIQKKFEGNYLENSKATFANFKKNANNYSIIHLSTHASSGDLETPASIKFYDQEILYSEIYYLNIHPDLVVLSACETGIGKLFKSEGAMSVARGFQLAGAQNLLFSLWKVNDYTTSVFMDLFYKNIKNKQSYLEANANAKREFLQNTSISNAKKSPYYWSAFVYYGTIESSENNNYLLYSLLLLSGIGLLFWSIYFFRKQKKIENTKLK
ncbi:CHAT domain-containing protein [Flavobacterium sp. P4023]|uniref:CHAT domain-containing protein n=1 Tax=Flavobacterium flabelliforme TaxID=2816119 RepID=A0ABS5CRU6_9FLAO|nr:CHAT domain-containing protein [Flavobacterium flabelliforme]